MEIKKALSRFFIPCGGYCYKIDRVIYDKTKGPCLKTKPCRFYKRYGVILGHCKLLNLEVTDMVKECDIKEYSNE